jgi:hypothetical protein
MEQHVPVVLDIKAHINNNGIIQISRPEKKKEDYLDD